MLTISLSLLGALLLAAAAGFCVQVGLAAAGAPDVYLLGYGMIGADLAFLLCYMALCRWRPALALPSLGSAHPMASLMRFGLLAVLAYGALVLTIGLVHGAAHIAPAFRWSRGAAAVLLLLAAAGEEIAFRGFLLAALRRRLQPLHAVLASAFLFAAIHEGVLWPGMLAFLFSFTFAVCMGLLVLTQRSLLPAICVHFIFNYATGMLALGYAAPFDHPGIFVYENGAPNDLMQVLQVLMFGAWSLYLLRRGACSAPTTNDPAHAQAVAESPGVRT